MKEAYENKGAATFLVCELQPGDQLEGVSLRALAGGLLQGFAAASFSQVGATRYIHYDVTGKTPFFRLMKEPVTKKVLLGALNGIADALLSAEANQVDPGTIILDPAHVLTDANTGETVMICMPLVAFRPGQTAGMLYNFILSNARLNNAEDAGFVAQLQEFLKSNPDPAPAAMKEELGKAEAAVSAPAESVMPVVAPPEQIVPEQPAQPMQQPQPQTDKPMSMFRLLDYHQEQAAREQAAREQAAREQAAREQAAREQAAREQAAREQAAREQAAREQAAREQAAREQAAREQAAREQAAREQAAREQAAREQAAREQAAREQAAREQAAREQAAREQAAREQAEQKKKAMPKFDFAIPGVQEVPVPVQPAAIPSVSPDDTTVVEAGQVTNAHAYLVRLKTGERAPITKSFFRIGKEKSYVDYCISDNSAISRAHAYIVNKDGEYFLADTHSTNHTYINGGMISPDVETRLFHGAKVHFANEEFEFKLH